MKTIIRYELKKIFQNKLFIGIFILCLTAMIAITAITVYQYNEGSRGAGYPINFMGGKKMPEVFVSNENIDTLRQALEDFESRDEIYYATKEEELADYQEGGSIYYGRYDIGVSNLLLQYDAGLISEQELDEAVSGIESATAIKKEYLPEYFNYLQPVKEYDNILSSIEEMELFAQITGENSRHDKDYRNFLAKKSEQTLEKGFTVGYDYGWENFYSILANDVGILLVLVLIFGLCNVFTSEYTLSTDAFLLSAKRGRGTLVGAKIISALIYTTVCFAVYVLLALSISFIFLGAEGMNAGEEESHIKRLFTVIPFVLLGSYLICFTTLAVSAFFKKQITSIAVSCLVSLVPFLAGWFYIENIYVSQLFELLPVSMVFGSYISDTCYIYLDGTFIDIRFFFPLVALLVFAVSAPVIYRKYTRHQVSN